MWERPVASAPRALLYECRPVPYRPSREVQRVRVPVGTPTRPARDPIGAPRSSYPLSPTLWTASSLLLIWLCCENERGRTRLLSRQRVPTTCLWLSRPMALAHLPTTAERLAPGSGPRDNASRSLDNGNRPAPLLPAGRPASATILTEKFYRPSCFRANHSSNMQQRG